MQFSAKARDAIARGSTKIRVVRNGMFQQLTFTVRKVQLGNVLYTELATGRQVDISELSRIAEDYGMPVEAPNGRAFPKGTSAVDFAGT
jgi:hypothetical protein